MLTRRQWLLNTGVAALAPWPAFAAPPPAAGRPVLVLGQSVPLTGPASEIGLAFAAGAKLHVDAFNARADSPVRLELRQLDDGNDPARAGANAKKLLADGAELLFGFVGTGSAEAAAAVARQEGALLVAPFAAPDSLRDPAQQQVFHVRPSMADEAVKMVQYCATIGLKRIAVLGEDDALGRAGLDAVQRALAELSLPPLAGSALVAPGGKVDDAVARLAALKPQAIIQASLFPATAAFIPKMRRTGYAGAFLNFSVVGIDPLFTALGKDIGGVVVSQVVPPPRSNKTLIAREYQAAINDSDQSPSYESLEGFIAAKALAEAVRRSAKPVNRANLQRALSGMTSFDVGGFRLNLRAGARDPHSSIELVSITADGRLVR